MRPPGPKDGLVLPFSGCERPGVSWLGKGSQGRPPAGAEAAVSRQGRSCCEGSRPHALVPLWLCAVRRSPKGLRPSGPSPPSSQLFSRSLSGSGVTTAPTSRLGTAVTGRATWLGADPRPFGNRFASCGRFASAPVRWLRSEGVRVLRPCCPAPARGRLLRGPRAVADV